MISYNYHHKTIDNLSHLLTGYGHDLSRSDIVVTYLVANAIIPWPKRDELIGMDELVNRIKEYVLQAFEPYVGSTKGYTSYETTKYLIFSLLFGINAADSLMVLSNVKDISISYEDGTWTLSIPGMKVSDDGQFYDEKMLKWCRRMSPAILSVIPEGELTSFMLPAFCTYCSLWMMMPQEYEYSDEDFTDIYVSAFKAAFKKYSDLADADPKKTICQLQWCLQNTPTDIDSHEYMMYYEYVKKCQWDDLCNLMQERWDAYLRKEEIKE